MTQEEKAKKYDDAIKRAKSLIGNVIIEESGQHIVEVIFPELKEIKDNESENEKIRKDIIKVLKGEISFTSEKENKKMITWLEKQGEHANFLSKIQVGDKVTRNKDGVLVNLNQLKRVAKQYNITGIGSKNAQGKLGEMIKNLKSADKAEPKFHEGDWIVWQDKYYKVNYNGCGYELFDQNGLSTSWGYKDVEDNAHLWTNEDANDGDVLQLGVVTAIFQKYIGNGNCKCYCSVCDGIFEIPSQDDDDYYGCHDAIPATKEQRKLLFKSMKDDGYEWDAEKKELKKINTYCQENCKGYQETGRCFFDEECKDKKEYMKQKHTEWNEEDEGFLNLLLAIFNNSHPNGIFTTGDIAVFNGACITSNKIINWLKSIKDRAQSKQVWSQDDKDYYDAIITKLEVTKDDAMLTDNQIEFLKSLKYKI